MNGACRRLAQVVGVPEDNDWFADSRSGPAKGDVPALSRYASFRMSVRMARGSDASSGSTAAGAAKSLGTVRSQRRGRRSIERSIMPQGEEQTRAGAAVHPVDTLASYYSGLY